MWIVCREGRKGLGGGYVGREWDDMGSLVFGMGWKRSEMYKQWSGMVFSVCWEVYDCYACGECL